MNTDEATTAAEAPDRPTFGDELAEFLPYVAAVVVLGPITLLSLMLCAPFLLVLALVAAPAVATGLLAAVAAILATPFLLFRHSHARRRRSPRSASAIAGVLASVVGRSL